MRVFLAVLTVTGALTLACVAGSSPESERAAPSHATAVATFAGGCFWCMEPPFEKLDGVAEVVSGYTGGPEPSPTYREVSSGKTGHAEAVRVRFDPSRVSYRRLLEVYWRQIDPTDAGGQFADRGAQYRTAIFVHDETQRRLAETTKAELEASGRFDRPIVTEIVPAGAFHPAEEYHQDFYKKDPRRYASYRAGSGRKGFLERMWDGKLDPWAKRYGRPVATEIRERLTPIQFRVTQEDGTERPFRNEFWENERPGIYVDVVSGEPLFASVDKYKSGTGWPSFTRPLEPDHVVERVDRKLGMSRTEVRSRHADSHLGHVFPDGPAPTGLRYCINSASLRFVPLEKLEAEGLGAYRHLFRSGR